MKCLNTWETKVPNANQKLQAQKNIKGQTEERWMRSGVVQRRPFQIRKRGNLSVFAVHWDVCEGLKEAPKHDEILA